jgi:hypothetical protein
VENILQKSLSKVDFQAVALKCGKGTLEVRVQSLNCEAHFPAQGARFFNVQLAACFVPQSAHAFLLGGVLGLRPLPPPVAFSVFFSMEKLHISVSSTDIKAPELSNSPQ